MKYVIITAGVVIFAALAIVGWRVTYEMRLPAARIEFATSLLKALGTEDRAAFAAHAYHGNRDSNEFYDVCRALVESVDISEPPIDVRERDSLTVIAEFSDGGKVVVPVFDDGGELYFVTKFSVWPAKESSDDR